MLDYYNFKLQLIFLDINYTDTNGLGLLDILLEVELSLTSL